jgi:hypothetical protein
MCVCVCWARHSGRHIWRSVLVLLSTIFRVLNDFSSATTRSQTRVIQCPSSDFPPSSIKAEEVAKVGLATKKKMHKQEPEQTEYNAGVGPVIPHRELTNWAGLDWEEAERFEKFYTSHKIDSQKSSPPEDLLEKLPVCASDENLPRACSPAFDENETGRLIANLLSPAQSSPAIAPEQRIRDKAEQEASDEDLCVRVRMQATFSPPPLPQPLEHGYFAGLLASPGRRSVPQQFRPEAPAPSTPPPPLAPPPPHVDVPPPPLAPPAPSPFGPPPLPPPRSPSANRLCGEELQEAVHRSGVLQQMEPQVEGQAHGQSVHTLGVDVSGITGSGVEHQVRHLAPPELPEPLGGEGAFVDI